jgi:hypothetical protein
MEVETTDVLSVTSTTVADYIEVCTTGWVKVNQVVAFAMKRYKSRSDADIFVCPHIIAGEPPNDFHSI